MTKENDEFVLELLEETRTEVSYADHKASIILAALGVAFSVYLASAIAGDWTPEDLSGVGTILWWLGSASGIFATVSAALAVWPRLGDSSLNGPIYYWGQAAKLANAEVLAERLAKDNTSLNERSVSQMWQLSVIVAAKYAWIRRSLSSAGLAFVLLLVAVFVEAV